MLSSLVDDLKAKVLGGKVKLLTALASTEGGALTSVRVDLKAVKFQFGLCGKLSAGVEIKVEVLIYSLYIHKI